MLGMVIVSSRINILGCDFDPWSTKQTLDKIQTLIDKDETGYLCTVNTAILMMMRKDLRLAKFVANSKMTVADGQPLIWVSKYMKTPLPERVTGVEIVDDLALLAEKNQWGIYLLGATMDIVSTVSSRLIKTHKELIISGYSDGYFTQDKADSRAADIKNSGAKILIIAMGVPRQEYFIENQWRNLGVNFVVGVGGSFDVIAGVTRRAPLWMQRYGLEWFYRALQEPKRLAWRYLTTNSMFIYLFLKEIVLGFKGKKES